MLPNMFYIFLLKFFLQQITLTVKNTGLLLLLLFILIGVKFSSNEIKYFDRFILLFGWYLKRD